MRLRVSGEQTGVTYALGAVVGEAGDVGIGHDALLSRFAEALVELDAQAIESTRAELIAAMGEAAAADAAAVIAAFNAYPRMADATGIPLEDLKADVTGPLRAELGLDTMRMDDR